MGTILCHLETHLRKLTLVVSLNEEGTSNCQRCYRSDQNKGQENQDNGQNNLLSLHCEQQSLCLSLYSIQVKPYTRQSLCLSSLRKSV